jgi:hypothetical protein
VKRNLPLLGFFQATGLVAYISLVALFMSNANRWFGEPETFLGPVMFLSLFVFSAATCGLIFGGLAVTIAWEEKKTKDAIRLCLYTLGWLAVYFLIVFFSQAKF